MSSYFRHLNGEIGTYAAGYLHLYAKWDSYSHKVACLNCLFLLVLLWASAAVVADSFVRYPPASKNHVLAILPRFLLQFILLISWPKTAFNTSTCIGNLLLWVICRDSYYRAI